MAEPLGLVLPDRSRVSPALYSALLMIVAIASGAYVGDLPAADMHAPDSLTGGCLRDHAEFWEFVLLPNSYLSPMDQAQALLEVTRGIEWRDYARHDADLTLASYPLPYVLANKIMTGRTPDNSLTQIQWVSNQLDMYRTIGAITNVASDFLHISSRISLEESKPRLILDLRPLNALINSPRFRYDCLRLFRTGLEKGDLLITVDFSQGYVHLGIGPDTLRFCGGTWMGVPMAWLACPFGLSVACFCFQRLSKCITTLLTRLGMHCLCYLDDMCIRTMRGTAAVGMTAAHCLAASRYVIVQVTRH